MGGVLVAAATVFVGLSLVLHPKGDERDRWLTWASEVPWERWVPAEVPLVREVAVHLRPWLLAQRSTATSSEPVWQAPSAASTASAPRQPSTRSASAETAFADCRELFPKGQPPAPPAGMTGLRDLCFEAFAVLYNPATKTPVYVVERLSRQSLQAAAGIERTDRFYPEARLPSSARAQLEDYRGSGYARGHMAAAANMPSEAAMAQSFSLANMVPQDMKHNSGPWSQVERSTREYVMHRARGPVHVITGTVYAEGIRHPQIGASRVTVPSHLYKLVYDPATGRSWVHWHQNAEGPQVMKPLDGDAELVRRVGIDFLHSQG